MVSNGSRGRYVAFSHSWGTSPRLTATSETLEDLQEGIATSFLPKTFRDAITITKKLGIRYLWIDCLCIIQDDRKDWERESATMGEVYKNSYLTISASDAHDSSSGFLQLRKSESYVSPATTSLGYDTPRIISEGDACSISYFARSIQSGDIERIASLQFFQEWMPGSQSHSPQRTEIGRFGKDFDPIAASHLSTRGWTLQERLLSPRTIHYTADQLYYECENGIRSEDGYVFETPWFSFDRIVAKQRIPHYQHGRQTQSISFAVGEQSKQPAIRDQGGWLSLVKDYSRRKLTKHQDKLTALAGLARLAAKATGDDYYAGIWGDHIYEDLSWRVQHQEESVIAVMVGDSMRSKRVPGSTVAEVSRPASYRAPSWSWASLDGPVEFELLSYSNLVARVRSCSVTPSSLDPFGQVSSGQLDIEVRCVKFGWNGGPMLTGSVL